MLLSMVIAYLFVTIAIGLWAMNVHEAIKSGAMKYARLTPFPPSGNDAIDQSARGRFQEVAHVIDPKQAQRDGATVEDIRLMRETVGPDMGVKAAGGIRDTATALAMLEAGATRIGASATGAIVGA